jgi:Ca-activated chloride channel family protein
MQSDNARQSDIERRLDRVESPEPPADLLDRIRGDIPEYLKPAPEAESPPPRRRRYRLLAASLFLAVAGGLVAYRVWRQAPPTIAADRPAAPALRESVPTPEPLQTAVVKPPAVTTEVGDVVESSGDDTVDTDLGGESKPPPQVRESRQAPLERQAEERRDERGAAPPAAAEPAEGGTLRETPKPVPHSERRAELFERRPKAKTVPPTVVPENEKVVGGVADVVVPPSSSVAGAEPVAATPLRQRQLEEQLRRIEVGVPAPPPPTPGPSTGGTAEPNDQPWGDMFFRPYGTNPFVDTEDDPQSTFGLDVDTGSYTLARGYLERGHLPPPEAIRVEEFLNFFDYRDPAPRRGEFTLTAEGAPSPWRRGPRYQLLRIGVHGREISAARRQDATLVFVVDVSGSMARDNRIELVRRALHLLLDQLGPGDRVGLVVYGSRGRVLLEPSGDLGAVRRAIDRLSTGGSTNAEEGLLLGYDLARRHFRPGAINRLVLCSDGVANVGRTGPESILARIGREAEEGIELTTVGFGMGNYNDVLMEQLADRGDGNYAYVDSLEEARRVFVENLTGTLQTIASDAKIQVEFDRDAVTRYRLLGYENRDVADHRFRDDTVDAGEIGAGHRVTALYEIKLADEASRRSRLAEVRLRYRSRATGRVIEDSLEVRRSQLADSWRAAAPSLRLAALAAELAEVLKRSYWARETRPEELRRRARTVERQFGGDRDVAELVWLVDRTADLVDWSAAAPD